MFDFLIRTLVKQADRVRVGLVSEPTAIAATDVRRRKVVALSLEDWLRTDHQNGDDDAAAAIDRYADGQLYAVIAAAGTTELVVVPLGKDRNKFAESFTSELATRTIFDNSIAAARINPPPPPPPPGYPPVWVVARLDAILRVSRLPVIETGALQGISERELGTFR